MAIRGGCLCGGMRYEVGGPLAEASNCHCSMCRRFHGAPFASYARVSPGDFRWLEGQELLQVYETSPGHGWAFCRNCGSSLGLPGDGKLASIAMGTIDGNPGIRPGYHMFVGSKAEWHEITDDLPRHDARPARKE